jgi:hypothetical protein
MILELFIKSTDELKQHNKSLEAKQSEGGLDKIPEEQQQQQHLDQGHDKDEEELAPMSMSRSISLPLTPGQKTTQGGQSQNSSL